MLHRLMSLNIEHGLKSHVKWSINSNIRCDERWNSSFCEAVSNNMSNALSTSALPRLELSESRRTETLQK